MKQRILAAFVAIMMILSVFAFSSCKPGDANVNDSSVDEGSKAPGKEETKKELTPKELFSASLANAFGEFEAGEILDVLNTEKELKDFAGNVELKINKLEAEGQNLTENGAMSLKGELKVDTANEMIALNLGANIFGEKPSIELVSDGKNTYITDLLGVNEKPIAMPTAEEILGAEGPTDPMDPMAPDVSQPTISKIDKEVITHFFTSAETVINNNFGYDAYVFETKDVTVGGKSFSGAKVITLSVSNEKAKKILGEYLDELLKNEVIKEALGEDASKDNIELEDLPKEIRIINTIVDEKSVAFDVVVDLPEIEESTESEETIEGEVAVTADGYDAFALHSVYVDGNFDLKFGPVDENGAYMDNAGYLAIVYTLENENENLVFSFTQDGTTEEYVKMVGTKKDGKHDGKFVLDIDGETLSFNYSVKVDENGESLKLDTVTLVSGEETMEIPVEISVSYTYNDTKVSVSGSVKCAIEEEFDIDLEFSINAEEKDVTIGAVTDSIPMEEFDISAYEEELMEKYPIIFAMIESAYYQPNEFVTNEIVA